MRATMSGSLADGICRATAILLLLGSCGGEPVEEGPAVDEPYLMNGAAGRTDRTQLSSSTG